MMPKTAVERHQLRRGNGQKLYLKSKYDCKYFLFFGYAGQLANQVANADVL